MPGDLNSSIAYLDVQFGAMDMLDSNSFDNVSDTKFKSTSNSNLDNTNVTSNTNLDINVTTQNTAMDPYSSAKANTQSSINSAISQSVSMLSMKVVLNIYIQYKRITTLLIDT